MRFRLKLFDIDGKELEIENKIIGDIIFESEKSCEFFINAIKISLPPHFQYKMIPIISVHMLVNNRKKSSVDE